MATSYDAPFGTGDRRSNILVSTDMGSYTNTVLSSLVDGSTASGHQWSPPSSYTVTDHYVRFTWGTGSSVVIDEFTFYQSNTASRGTWQFQGSDDETTWTDIGDTFTLGGATTNVVTTPSANTTGYEYYQIVGVSGTDATSGYWAEFDFKGEYLIEPAASPSQMAQGFTQVLIQGTDTKLEMSQASVQVLVKLSTPVLVAQGYVSALIRNHGKRIITQYDTGVS